MCSIPYKCYPKVCHIIWRTCFNYRSGFRPYLEALFVDADFGDTSTSSRYSRSQSSPSFLGTLQHCSHDRTISDAASASEWAIPCLPSAKKSLGLQDPSSVLWPTVFVGLVIPPTSVPVVQRLARPSSIRETRGSIPGLALSFLLPQRDERMVRLAHRLGSERLGRATTTKNAPVAGLVHSEMVTLFGLSKNGESCAGDEIEGQVCVVGLG